MKEFKFTIVKLAAILLISFMFTGCTEEDKETTQSDDSNTETVYDSNDDYGDTMQTASTLSGALNGEIEESDDVDYFKITITSSGELRLYTSGNLDSTGTLYNSSGSIVGENDDISNSNYNFEITYTVTPGTYYLKVEGFDSTKIGNYTVYSEFIGDDNTTQVEYYWGYGSWSDCTGDCGANNGTQSRLVACTSVSGDNVAEWYCDASEKLSSTQSCTTRECEEEVVEDVIENITHNGLTYNAIISSNTGKTWLDRNLGASRICIAIDDELCYGDYYQWGRDTDGHQIYTSNISRDIETTLTPNHGEYISIFSYGAYQGPYDWTTADDDGSNRSFNWNPCPTGFKVPSIEEFANEELENKDNAFNKFKIPAAGNRYYVNDADMNNQGVAGYLWSSTPNERMAKRLTLSMSIAQTEHYGADRTSGMSVRCIKE